ncbi:MULTISPECIES: XisH family protein [unclassified Tolypothrix]|uniref:XisH family protein n=1 Tax=unclassified Tolypothrix TaxID=2649714 RepID=UPI0005EAB7AB|nr:MULTISPECIES: XisH family protein [unclassified Tolypothrix]BAY94426.1 excision controlling factor protein, XisH like protein [Microchaete diplosiphon NIES-3275]EKF02874.1 XisH protein [Tolypothrix sp. PCC 7601]MBE9086841.1 XisH family protein [Tolypothrix sp. LEGE 11397]UYD28142.1 XisH family protein [Tolypothrix sp. PCC 7712]UYD35985.1 XisH family protein [Tolypothrix sp. PCC 7601]
MSAKDRFHEAVKTSLQKEQWVITHDPLRIEFGEKDEVRIDLGAEQLVAAEKAGKKIAVEIKSFLSDSALFDFHLALGQFLNYRLVLETREKERTLYLAIPIAIYESFFQRDLPQASVRQYQVKLIVYDPVDEVIVEWIN